MNKNKYDHKHKQIYHKLYQKPLSGQVPDHPGQIPLQGSQEPDQP